MKERMNLHTLINFSSQQTLTLVLGTLGATEAWTGESRIHYTKL